MNDHKEMDKIPEIRLSDKFFLPANSNETYELMRIMKERMEEPMAGKRNRNYYSSLETKLDHKDYEPDECYE
ncbi:MAG: hypothetical protein ACXW1B_03685 [Nitrososphaeraceae archaeon]